MSKSEKADAETTACPTCRRPWPAGIKTGAQLVATMQAHHASVYLRQKGGYGLSRGLGRVERAAIEEAIHADRIVEKFPEKHHEYWVLAESVPQCVTQY